MAYRLKRINRMHDERNSAAVDFKFAKKFYLWEMRALNEYELSGDALLVYCCITEPADTLTNRLSIHTDAIADDYGISQEEVDIALQMLVNNGIIDRTEYFNGDGYETIYRINKTFWDRVLTNRDEMLEEEIEDAEGAE